MQAFIPDNANSIMWQDMAIIDAHGISQGRSLSSVKKLGTTRQPLTKRVVSASAWAFAGYGLGLVIRFGSNLVLTRLLVPEMFGVVAIAIVMLVGLSMFSDIGLAQVIIRSKRGDESTFANTVWTMQILRGALLWVFGIFISAILAFGAGMGFVSSTSVYAHPSLPPVIAVLSVTALIEGFTSTKGAQSRRNVQLGKLIQVEILAQLAGVSCMFGWVYFERSIWALVFGALCGSLAKTILTHVLLDGRRNRLQWSGPAFREIVGFGKWIFLSSILGFLVANADRLLLGWLVNARTLGVYSVAYTLASAIDLIMTRMIYAVAFPAFSEIVRERPDKLKGVYYKFFGAIASGCYFCCGIVIVWGGDFVNLLYDSRYSDAGWMLQILAFGALAIPFQVATQCFLALGMPHIHSQILLARLVMLISGLTVAFHFFGLSGALWGIVASQWLSVVAILLWLARLKLLDLKRELALLGILPLGLLAGQALTWLTASLQQYLHRLLG